MTNGPDWTKVENVFSFIAGKNGRPLTAGEKELILGQRQINRRFFEAINTILDAVSPSASCLATQGPTIEQRLATLKEEFQTLPGERPPGCRGDAELDHG